MTTEKHDALSGASPLTDVLCRLKAHRDSMAGLVKEDVFLEDGSLVISKDWHNTQMAKLDECIEIFSLRASS